MIRTSPKDEKPNINLSVCEAISKEGIKSAYEDLITAYHGIDDFVGILDGIYEGAYTLSEVMIAGCIILYAPDGYFIKGDCGDPANWHSAKYININGQDMVLLKDSGEVLSGKELKGCLFEERTNGKRYRLSSAKRTPKKTRADRANSQPSEDGKQPSNPKESLPSSDPKCKNPNTASARSRERKNKP